MDSTKIAKLVNFFKFSIFNLNGAETACASANAIHLLTRHNMSTVANQIPDIQITEPFKLQTEGNLRRITQRDITIRQKRADMENILV